VKRLLHSALNLLSALPFPGYCPICNRESINGSGWMCDICWRDLPLAGKNLWRSETTLKGACLAVFQYSDTARQFVHQMKFYGREDIAARLGSETAGRFADWMDISRYSAVTSVPLHPARIRERGYDQNLILARAVAERLSLPLRTDFIRRVKHRPPQSRLSDEERRHNLKDAFAPQPNLNQPPQGTVLLVDDVIHTGATALGCIEALERTGVQRVFVLAACG